MIADVDATYQPTQNERLRQGIVSALRKFASADLRLEMQRDYETRVQPALLTKNAAPKDWRDVDAAMTSEASYRFYSVMRYNAQEMVWHSVQDPVERGLPQMIEAAERIAATRPTGGSLRLNPDFEVPRYVAGIDVHLIPGSYDWPGNGSHIAQGAVVSHGAAVFYASMPNLRGIGGGVGESIARWLKASRPDFKPRRMLDIATGIGRNLFPYIGIFADVEAHGLDVAAPGLRYGHAIAERDGLTVHFSQQSADRIDYPDGHFDLIVSSFFFHEVPVKTTQQILNECHRLLAPGGIMVHMELPPEKMLDPWDNFRWNWDTANNNEPNYTLYRSQDPAKLCAAAGFDPARAFEMHIPNYETFGAANFAKFVRGEMPAPAHAMGGWYVFGAEKAG